MRSAIAATVVLVLLGVSAFGGPNDMTYQGSLADSTGRPIADGDYLMRFRLYSAETGGSSFWLENHTVPVRGGVFSVILGEQSPLRGQYMTQPELWLSVVVDVDQSGTLDGDEILSPRQKLSGGPWVRTRLSHGQWGPNLISGYGANLITFGVSGGTISGGGSASFPNYVYSLYGTVGGGEGNRAGDGATTDSAMWATVGGGRSNSAAGESSTVGGGETNRAGGIASTIGGGSGNRATGDYTTVAGGYDNYVTAAYGTIAGGGRMFPAQSSSRNMVTDEYGFIGGGAYNLAGSDDANPLNARYATVAGGNQNVAHSNAFVGGGTDNAATGTLSAIVGGIANRAWGQYSSIGGGFGNEARGNYSTVGGGQHNEARGAYTAIPGGRLNEANGSYSFAAGRRAKANQQGSFVWADSQDEDFWSFGVNTFSVRANGGIHLRVDLNRYIEILDSGANLIATSAGTPTPAHLTLSGTWVNASSRESKENFKKVDGRDVLEKLAQMPISEWNYKVEKPDIKRMGPMAEDFHAAFGLGATNKAIATIDADGVALAAIQGLYKVVQEKDARIESLEARLADQQKREAEVRSRLAAMELAIQQLASGRASNADAGF